MKTIKKINYKVCFDYYMLLFVKSPNVNQYEIENNIKIDEITADKIHHITSLLIRFVPVIAVLVGFSTHSVQIGILIHTLTFMFPFIVGGICVYRSRLK